MIYVNSTIKISISNFSLFVFFLSSFKAYFIFKILVDKSQSRKCLTFNSDIKKRLWVQVIVHACVCSVCWERESVCVCVWEREREIVSETDSVRESVCVCDCKCFCVCVCDNRFVFLPLRPKLAICLEMCTVKTDYINHNWCYRVCHGFRLTNRVAYFQVNYDLF